MKRTLFLVLSMLFVSSTTGCTGCMEEFFCCPSPCAAGNAWNCWDKCLGCGDRYWGDFFYDKGCSTCDHYGNWTGPNCGCDDCGCGDCGCDSGCGNSCDSCAGGAAPSAHYQGPTVTRGGCSSCGSHAAAPRIDAGEYVVSKPRTTTTRTTKSYPVKRTTTR